MVFLQIDLLHFYRSEDLESKILFVQFEILGNGNVSPNIRFASFKGFFKRHTGQIMNPVHCTQGQRIPTRLPGAACLRCPIYNNEIRTNFQPHFFEVVPGRKPGLASPDDGDFRLVTDFYCHLLPLNANPIPVLRSSRWTQARVHCKLHPRYWEWSVESYLLPGSLHLGPVL